jgi:disulfide bond formation protein DsbB
VLRTAPLIVLILSVAVVGAALLAQYGGGLVPCELCLYQRWPYFAVIALMALAFALGRRGVSRVALALAAVIFVASAGLACYHLGVEQHWFAGPTACTGDGLAGGSIEEIRRRLLATPVVRCDLAQWSVVGIDPLVSGNLVVSLVLFVVSWWLATRMGRK